MEDKEITIVGGTPAESQRLRDRLAHLAWLDKLIWDIEKC